MHVASIHRSCDLSKIDFVFGGGSILQLLASKAIPRNPSNKDKLLVQIIPTTTADIIFISKYPIYRQNLADIGFQFERFITGKRMDYIPPTSSMIKNQHLQVFQIGNKENYYNILCSAECDGITYDGNDVIEMKSSNQHFSHSTKVMFQMISNGSTILYSGQNCRGSNKTTLQGINKTNLADIIDKCLLNNDCATLERNIMYCLNEILYFYKRGKMNDRFDNNKMDDSKSSKTSCSSAGNKKSIIHEIYFQSGRLMLRPCYEEMHLFFPSDDVMKEMLP